MRHCKHENVHIEKRVRPNVLKRLSESIICVYIKERTPAKGHITIVTKLFSVKPNLASHYTTHTVEQPYSCDVLIRSSQSILS